MPKDETVERILDHLKIPYLAYWSFGERLPVLEENPDNPKTLAFSYQMIARLLLGNLDWEEVKRGTRAVEAEAAQKLALEKLTLKAAKAREEAQRDASERERIARQAELEALKKRQENFIQSLWTPSSKRHRRRAIWSLVGAWFSGLYLAMMIIGVINIYFIDNPADLKMQMPGIMAGMFVMCALLGWGLYASVQARRRNQWLTEQLQNERVTYEAGIGKYESMPPVNALSEFISSVHRILIAKKPQPSRNLPSASTHQQTMVNDPVINPINANGPIDVFISYEHSALTRGWLREFTPLFETWLKEAMGREPRVYDPERSPDVHELAPSSWRRSRMHAALFRSFRHPISIQSFV